MSTDPTPPRSWYIRGGRIVDPAGHRDEHADIFVADGVIRELPSSIPRDAAVLDAAGLVVTTGLIDLHTHLREPGGEAAETIGSGTAAAARGGFTTVVAMPNTSPAADSPERIEFVKRRAADRGLARVLPSGSITCGRRGTELANLRAMAEAGAAAFTDDGSAVVDDSIMCMAMETASALGIPVMDHALDPVMAGDGVMNLGIYSRQLGLPGIPAEAETRMVARDIELAAKTGCPVHIQHVSAGESVRLIGEALAAKVSVSCEATPHHLALSDADVRADDTSTKVSPPLRSKDDRRAIVDAVRTGIITAFATDHAPHREEAKSAGFLKAPFGMVGLETAVGVTYTTLVRNGIIGLTKWLELWTSGPAAVLRRNAPSLGPGEPADLALLDLESEWTVNPGNFASKSRNSPFTGWKLTGAAAYTFCSGQLTWDSGKGRIDTRAGI